MSALCRRRQQPVHQASAVHIILTACDLLSALQLLYAAQVQAGVQKLSVGRPEDNCDITPVVSSSSADFITGLVEDAQAKGATFLTPYKR